LPIDFNGIYFKKNIKTNKCSGENALKIGRIDNLKETEKNFLKNLDFFLKP